MALSDPPPTEYFGPHAKRWTHPGTGVTLSLRPRDYYREVAKEQLREEELRRLRYLKSNTVSEKAVEAITAREEKIQEAVSAAWNDEALDEGVVTIDRLGDPRAAPAAGLFKEKGVLIAPLSGWNPPEHQRYDLNGFAEMANEAEEAAAVAAAAARSAEASRDKALEDAGMTMIPRDQNIDWNLVDPDLAAAVQRITRMRNATLADRDGSLGLIRLSTPVVKTPAARHFKRRRWTRIAAKLVLVYIIAVIGVAAVAGVFS